MVLSFECQQCQADFELELQDLVQEPELMACPNCKAKADLDLVEAMAASLDEAVSIATRLSRRFRIELAMDTDDIEIEDEETFDDEDSLWANDVEEEEEEEE
jgi:DNA-directed RNA polymerase subunit RPC12/RpoP